MTSWVGNSALQVLPDSRKGQRNIGSPGSRQDVGGPGPAGTAVFRTAYGLHDQLSATVRADTLRAAPDNAGQPAGLIPVYTNAGHQPDALRGAELPGSHAACGNQKDRVGCRKSPSPVGRGDQGERGQRAKIGAFCDALLTGQLLSQGPGYFFSPTESA